MHDAILGWLHGLAWLGFLLYWIASARGTKRAVRAEPPWLRVGAYWLPLALAVALLGPGSWFGDSALRAAFVPGTPWWKTPGLLLAIAGIAPGLPGALPARPQLEQRGADQAGP